MGTKKSVTKEYRWYKGNLHMHSLWSDGEDFPEIVAESYKSRGYHFIAFTEHDRLQTGEFWVEEDSTSDYVDRFGRDWVGCETLAGKTKVRLKPLYEYRHLLEDPGRFMILNGEEVSISWQGGEHWINVINHGTALSAQESDGTSPRAMQMVLSAAAEQDTSTGRRSIVFLDHPNYRWNATAEDIAAAEGLRFIEIYTAFNLAQPYGDELHASAERIWDIALARRLSKPGGNIIYGLAGDDSHSGKGKESIAGAFRGWIMVRASRLTPESITNAMNRGDFYASTGVDLESVEYDKHRLSLKIRPEEGVHYVTRFIGTQQGVDLTPVPILASDGTPLRATHKYSAEVGRVLVEVSGVEAQYDFTGDELYVRVLILSDRPHPHPTVPGELMKAWTQPVALLEG